LAIPTVLSRLMDLTFMAIHILIYRPNVIKTIDVYIACKR
jgi:hypothetical protein